MHVMYIHNLPAMQGGTTAGGHLAACCQPLAGRLARPPLARAGACVRACVCPPVAPRVSRPGPLDSGACPRALGYVSRVRVRP